MQRCRGMQKQHTSAGQSRKSCKAAASPQGSTARIAGAQRWARRSCCGPWGPASRPSCRHLAPGRRRRRRTPWRGAQFQIATPLRAASFAFTCRQGAAWPTRGNPNNATSQVRLEIGSGSWVMGQLLGLMTHATRAGLRTQVMDCSRLWKPARSGSIDACMSGPSYSPNFIRKRVAALWPGCAAHEAGSTCCICTNFLVLRANGPFGRLHASCSVSVRPGIRSLQAASDTCRRASNL